MITFTNTVYKMPDNLLIFEQQGSRLRADYDVSWDTDDFFHAHAKQYSARSRIQGRATFREEASVLHSEVAGSRHEGTRPRRFRVCLP